jgi:hypothetical protein
MQMHVVEAKHNRRSGQVAVALADNVEKPNPATAKCYMYQDVPRDLWVRFREAEFGPETDVIWESEFSGKWKEREVSLPTFLMLPTPDMPFGSRGLAFDVE